MENFKGKLVNDVLDLIILKLLDSKEMCGYDLVKALKKKSGGYINLSEGYIYSQISKMEDRELIGNYWCKSDKDKNIPKKKYYIEDMGRKALDIKLKEWRKFTKGINMIIS